MKPKDSQTYCSTYTGDDSIPAFVAFAVEQYKHYKNISGEEAMELLSASGALEHLAEYYDVMHTQGVKWLLAEMDDLIAKSDCLTNKEE